MLPCVSSTGSESCIIKLQVCVCETLINHRCLLIQSLPSFINCETVLVLFDLFIKSFDPTSAMVCIYICKPTLNYVMLIQGHNAVSQGLRVTAYQIHVYNAGV